VGECAVSDDASPWADSADVLAWYHLEHDLDDYAAIKQMQLQRFNGTGWVKIGGIVNG
jgi:hypothetical protein